MSEADFPNHMTYDIAHITRFDYGAHVKFARCNLRLEPIDWPGQRLESYMLRVSPAGRTTPARAANSSVKVSPDCSIASRAAARVNCVNRS